MNQPTLVLLDTAFFKAHIDDKDDFHDKAKSIWVKISDSSYRCVTTNYIIDETVTLLRYKCNLSMALDFRIFFSQFAHMFDYVRISIEDEESAWHWFEKEWKKLSFTDCTSFAVMKRLGIQEVATFDDHFKKAGFTVVGN